MTSYCKCGMCKKLRKTHKYPLCEHCGEHHDTSVICTEMKHLFQSKDSISLCKYCGKKHDERLHCLEQVKAKMVKPDITQVQKINSKDCDYYIELENGKYTVYLTTGDHKFEALRYGEPWRDLCGDNLIYFLMVNLIKAKAINKEAMKLLEIIGANCTGETKEAIQQLKEKNNGNV